MTTAIYARKSIPRWPSILLALLCLLAIATSVSAEGG